MQWRKLSRALHRDIGYSVASLVLAYALSGLAVNHLDDWNPSYRFAERAVDIGPLPAGTLDAQAAFVVEQLALDPRAVRGHFQETEHDLRVFLTEGQEARVDMRTGRGQLKTLGRRPVLFEVNALHLNNLKGIWTWVADLFAVALIVLSITGITMLKGSGGITGRGKYFLAAGLSVPVGFIIYLHA